MAIINQAIILAGGKGERLRPLTNDRPKPMVEINGKPIIVYQIERLQKVGVKEIVISCGYLWQVIRDFLGDGSSYDMKFDYCVEETPLGRGGGIKKAMSQLTPLWKDVFVFNGDILSNSNLLELSELHQSKNAIATLTIVPLKSPYGIVDFNLEGEIEGFREKPELPYWINAGMYVFSSEIKNLLPDLGDHETETFPILPKERFIVFQTRDYWRGVDTIKDRTEAEKEVVAVLI